GGDSADDRDEGGQEHEQGHGNDQRNPEEGGADTDADGVDGGDEDLHAHVLDECGPAPLRGTGGHRTRRDRQQLHHPTEDVLSVVEEEERREQAHGHTGEEGADRGGGLQGTAEELAAVVLEEVRGGTDAFVDIPRDRRGVDAEGAGGQPAADSRHTGDD